MDRQWLEVKAKLFRGFADPSRLAIVEVLRHGPATVGAIACATGQGITNVSNHLRCLRDCGLVRRERRGQYVLYQLADERCAQVLLLAEQLLRETAVGVAACPNYRAPQNDDGQERSDGRATAA